VISSSFPALSEYVRTEWSGFFESVKIGCAIDAMSSFRMASEMSQRNSSPCGYLFGMSWLSRNFFESFAALKRLYVD